MGVCRVNSVYRSLERAVAASRVAIRSFRGISSRYHLPSRVYLSAVHLLVPALVSLASMQERNSERLLHGLSAIHPHARCQEQASVLEKNCDCLRVTQQYAGARRTGIPCSVVLGSMCRLYERWIERFTRYDRSQFYREILNNIHLLVGR